MTGALSLASLPFLMSIRLASSILRSPRRMASAMAISAACFSWALATASGRAAARALAPMSCISAAVSSPALSCFVSMAYPSARASTGLAESWLITMSSRCTIAERAA